MLGHNVRLPRSVTAVCASGGHGRFPPISEFQNDLDLAEVAVAVQPTDEGVGVGIT
jgi:hypothetical protein